MQQRELRESFGRGPRATPQQAPASGLAACTLLGPQRWALSPGLAVVSPAVLSALVAAVDEVIFRDDSQGTAVSVG